ncbi:MAG: alpha/beta hydrolase-fold protein [Chitinophagaceae bacterium]
MCKLCMLSIALAAVITVAGQYPQVIIPGSRVEKITSAEVAGQEYELHILLPGGYSSRQRYPVVYVMDSQWDFPLVKSVYGQQYYDGFIPELIIVGVTWGGTAPNPDSLRVRDYTPTHDGRPQSGGADKFLAFMRNELFPFMEKKYNADPQNRSIAGCSLGGLITLYALFTQPGMFSGYAAASPAIGWDKEVIYQYEKKYFQNPANPPARLYMTIGEVERNVPGFEKFAAFMKSRDYPSLQFRSKILENTGHSGTKSETFSRGLQYIFERPRLVFGKDKLWNYTGDFISASGEIARVVMQDTIAYVKIWDVLYRLYIAGDNDFYATSEFFKMHFSTANNKITGFRLDRYGRSDEFTKMK